MRSIDLKVLSIDVEQQSEDTFGRVSSCSVKIACQLRKALVTSRKRISAGGVDLTWELRSTSNKLLGTAFMDCDDLDDGSAHVDCLLLNKNGKGQTLLLDRVEETSDQYRRIGVAELLGLDEDDGFLPSGVEQSIRLV